MMTLTDKLPDNVVGSDHSGAPDCGLFGSSGSSVQGHNHQVAPPVTNSLMSNNSILAAAAASAAASNYQAEAARQFLQQLSASQALNPPSQVDLRESSAVNSELGVWATETIPQGTRFGPFMGKWTMEPTHQKFAWEVLVPAAGIRGFLDASEFGTWLKHFQCTHRSDKQNIKHFLLAGQIYYESSRKIEVGEELLLGPKEPIKLDGSNSASSTTGSSHNGETETDRNSDGNPALSKTGESEISDEEDEGVKCIKCDKLFLDIFTLDDHMIDAHSHNRGQYPCEHCPKTFAWRPNLLRHKMVHGEFRRFPCENCDKVFTDPSNLQRHIRTNHVGARSHACPECGKTFATSSGLKQHTHIHSSVKPFRCEVCLKAYTQFSNLCRHKRMHANCRMQIKCHKCGQAFSTVTSLSKHRRFCDSTPTPPTGHAYPAMSPIKSPPPLTPAKNGSFDSTKSPLRPSQAPPPHPPPLYPGMLQPYLLQQAMASSATGSPLVPFYPNFLQQLARFQNSQAQLSSLLRSNSPNLTKSSLEENVDVNRNKSSPEKQVSESEVKFGLTSAASEVKPKAADEVKLLPEATQGVNVVKEEFIEVKDHEERKSASEEVKPDQDEVKEVIKKEGGTPLDLSLTKKELEEGEEDIQVTENEDNLRPDESIEEKDEDEDMLDDDLEATEEEIEDQDNQTDLNPPSTGKGFKPLQEGKSFVPIRDQVTFKPYSDAKPSNETSTAATSISSISNTPIPSYPRPIHPLLLEAMYRMQRPFPAPSLPRPQYPFPPSLMAAASMGTPNGPSFPSSRYPPTDFLHHLHHPGHHPSPISSGKPKDRYGCKFCGKVFPRSANLTRHLRTHTGEQPYKCKYCERSFSISSNLQRHVRNIHNKEKPFKCPLCDRCFGQQTNLDRHLKKHETCSDPMSIVDSPEAKNPDEEGYFDEIRSFMGKVTSSQTSGFMHSPSNASHHSDQDIDVEEDIDMEHS